MAINAVVDALLGPHCEGTVVRRSRRSAWWKEEGRWFVATDQRMVRFASNVNDGAIELLLSLLDERRTLGEVALALKSILGQKGQHMLIQLVAARAITEHCSVRIDGEAEEYVKAIEIGSGLAIVRVGQASYTVRPEVVPGSLGIAPFYMSEGGLVVGPLLGAGLPHRQEGHSRDFVPGSACGSRLQMAGALLALQSAISDALEGIPGVPMLMGPVAYRDDLASMLLERDRLRQCDCQAVCGWADEDRLLARIGAGWSSALEDAMHLRPEAIDLQRPTSLRIDSGSSTITAPVVLSENIRRAGWSSIPVASALAERAPFWERAGVLAELVAGGPRLSRGGVRRWCPSGGNLGSVRPILYVEDDAEVAGLFTYDLVAASWVRIAGDYEIGRSCTEGPRIVRFGLASGENRLYKKYGRLSQKIACMDVGVAISQISESPFCRWSREIVVRQPDQALGRKFSACLGEPSLVLWADMLDAKSSRIRGDDQSAPGLVQDALWARWLGGRQSQLGRGELDDSETSALLEVARSASALVAPMAVGVVRRGEVSVSLVKDGKVRSGKTLARRVMAESLRQVDQRDACCGLVIPLVQARSTVLDWCEAGRLLFLVAIRIGAGHGMSSRISAAVTPELASIVSEVEVGYSGVVGGVLLVGPAA